MQIRRRAVWVSMGLAMLLILPLVLGEPQAQGLGPLRTTAHIILSVNLYLPIIFGVLMADRLRRDDRLATTEFFQSLPVGTAVRLWGKYFGAWLGTALPLGLGYLILIVAYGAKIGSATVGIAFLPVFAAVVLPGLLFVGAVSIACSRALPVPVYIFLFTGYWFWANLALSRVPNPSCGPLAPSGRYISIGFFGIDGMRGCGLIQHEVGWIGAISSAFLLIVVGFVAMMLLQASESWGRSRQ